VTSTNPRARTHVRLVFVVAMVVLAADLVSKVLIVSELGSNPKRLLDGAIYLVQDRNSGAAFSLGTGFTIVLTAVAITVTVTIVRMAAKLTSPTWAVALGGILGGACGNLVDRFFRAPGPGRGHVVDWISLFASDGHVWPLFNLADSAIVGGAALAVLLTVRNVPMHHGAQAVATSDVREPKAAEPTGDDG